jgi:hypothetical protein
MEPDVLMRIHLNPLVAFFADPAWSGFQRADPTVQAAVDFLCDPATESSLDAIISRYKEIKDEPQSLFAAPNEPAILQKLVWPLRNAKSSYMLGNYLGTIALCGMVAEMIAILLFDMSNPRFQQGEMSENTQQALFGSAFEKLGQDRRVAVLRAYGLIDDQAKSRFDEIRTLRKRYLHLWSHAHDTLKADAVKCYQSTLATVVAILGQDVQDGQLCLNPSLAKYLQERGMLHQANESEEAGQSDRAASQ